MFTKILIPVSIAALGLIAVPSADARVHHHHHAAPMSLFASPHHVTAAHARGVRSLKTHTHRSSLKSRHVHASLHHVSKVSHATKPLSEGGTADPNA